MSNKNKFLINVIWIDPNYNNKENIAYINELKKNKFLIIECFTNTVEAIKYIKKIKFEETNIITCGKYYTNFIMKLKENLNNIYIIPKIIVFTKNKEKFLKCSDSHKSMVGDPFYNLGGIKISFKDIKNFILKPLNKKNLDNEKEENIFITSDYKHIIKEINNEISNKNKNLNLVFEYIDCKEKLYYPLLYKSLIEIIKTDKIDIFTEKLFDKYAENSEEIQKLLFTIKNIVNIPIELLSKYYARLYTINSDNNENNFYTNINKDLRENKKDEYLPYIKVLYQGLKLKSLSLASNKILYRGGFLSNKEIDTIKDYLKIKKKDLPATIVFSKTFLSFTKSKKIAEDFLEVKNDNKELNKVLFIVEKDENIDYSLSTHADISYISVYPCEKEVLFFPFSAFEIQEIHKNCENSYEIKLLYLGKYLKELIKDENKVNNIPNSVFKKYISESGLIERNNIQENPEFLLKKYYKYKEEIDKNNFSNNMELMVEKEINKIEINKEPNKIISHYSSDSIIRIISEFKEVKNYPDENIKISFCLPDEQDITNWRGIMLGPLDSNCPYRFGYFLFYVKFPQDYPNIGPSIYFETPIYHPNVNSKSSQDVPLGYVCLGILNKWKPEYKMRDVIINLFELLYFYDTDSPFSLEITNQKRNNKEVYIELIKYFTRKYAHMNNFRDIDTNCKEWNFKYP